MPVPRTGVLAAGHFIVDHVRVVEHWPDQDTLVSILSEKRGNGGCAFNCLLNLQRLRPDLPLYAAGLVGEDEDGRWVREQCRSAGIADGGLKTVPGVPTSYTLVMTAAKTGRRTFFHQRGATVRFGPADVAFANSPAKILHFGYVGLLDGFEGTAHGGHGCAPVLAAACAAGLLTSVDLVSNASADLQKLLAPALPEIGWLFGNEYELARAAAVPPPGPDPRERFESARLAARRLLAGGVRQAVFVHFPEGAVAVTPTGEFLQGAARIPAADIRGSAGAGDAFSAGVLLGLHDGWTVPAALELGVCAAAVSLRDETCSAALRSAPECLDLGRQWGFQPTFG